MQDVILYYGAITGAISNPLSPEGKKHAELFYEEMRHTNEDVIKIVENTEFTYEQIMLVKRFLFFDEHLINDNGIQQIKLFEPSLEIAHSWQRLAFMKDKIKEMDIILIKHELMEQDLMLQGISQDIAHKLAEERYNYTKECLKEYPDIKNQYSDDNIISGATKRNRRTH